MPALGGLCPMPFRLGGGRRALRVFEAIQNARGSAYSTSQSSAVYAENVGIARTIDRDVYGANARLAAQFTPSGMTAAGLLPRWEKILGITPAATATEASRRNVVAATWLRIGQGNFDQAIRDAILPILGPFFVGIQYQTGANALAWWPGNSGIGEINLTSGSTQSLLITTAPSGGIQNAWYGSLVAISNASVGANNSGFHPFLITSINTSTSTIQFVNASGSSPDYGVGGSIGTPTLQFQIVNPAVAWSSTVAHLDIQVQIPIGQTLSQFYAAIGSAVSVLDSILPAWTTWDWWIPSPQNPGNYGFYLDETDLDVEAFDV